MDDVAILLCGLWVCEETTTTATWRIFACSQLVRVRIHRAPVQQCSCVFTYSRISNFQYVNISGNIWKFEIFYFLVDLRGAATGPVSKRGLFVYGREGTGLIRTAPKNT